MLQVVIYLEIVALGTGKLARYGACAILTCGEAVKAIGQYLGQQPIRAVAVGAAARLALGALTRPCAVKVYSSSVLWGKKQNGLFDRPNTEWVYMPPGGHFRESAAYLAAYEIALGGEVADFILEYALRTEDARRAMVAY